MTHDNKFVTPDSPAVLPSITNKSLMQLAEDEGMVVEHRPVPFSEVGSFKEVGACGTAVVMTTIKQIVKGGEVRRVLKIEAERNTERARESGRSSCGSPFCFRGFVRKVQGGFDVSLMNVAVWVELLVVGRQVVTALCGMGDGFGDDLCCRCR